MRWISQSGRFVHNNRDLHTCLEVNIIVNVLFFSAPGYSEQGLNGTQDVWFIERIICSVASICLDYEFSLTVYFIPSERFALHSCNEELVHKISVSLALKASRIEASSPYTYLHKRISFLILIVCILSIGVAEQDSAK